MNAAEVLRQKLLRAYGGDPEGAMSRPSDSKRNVRSSLPCPRRIGADPGVCPRMGPHPRRPPTFIVRCARLPGMEVGGRAFFCPNIFTLGQV